MEVAAIIGPVTWPNKARIGLGVLWVGVVVWFVASGGAPGGAPLQLAVLVICGGGLFVSYKEDPQRFHEPMSRGQVLRVVLPLVAFAVVLALVIAFTR